MITLTKRGKFSSAEDVWAAFARFSRLMKKRFGDDRWKYVAVPELHADGETWHMHVAVHGFYWAGTVRRLWFRALGGVGDESGSDTPGNVDLKDFSVGCSRRGARTIAKYIAKYVGKGAAARGLCKRVFAASRGLHPNRVARWHIRYWSGIGSLVAECQRQLCSLGAVETGHAWFWSRMRRDGGAGAYGFVLSTVRVGT
ncbi:rolling circle replication-associated protein [Povalibacter sp.]|uniref:rolling circle replication-associated protein n=1 Tax=Povalibacter sp. TaxID=1962978 RepID=UPI003FA7D1FF